MDLTEKTHNTLRHPWELSRSQMILDVLNQFPRDFSYADVGAGDRFFTEQIRQITTGKVTAVDSGYPLAIEHAGSIECLNDLALLKDASVDCLVMMDVLEHVPDEVAFLALALEKLKPQGYLVLTVPAMQFLFSSHDVFLKHYRRYNRPRLLRVLSARNVTVQRCHYFYGSLFVLRSLACFLARILPPRTQVNDGIGAWKRSESHGITQIIRTVLNWDFLALSKLGNLGVFLPGLSLIAVCRKHS